MDITSHGLSENYLIKLNEHFNQLHPGVNAEITINRYDSDYDTEESLNDDSGETEPRESRTSVRYLMIYRHSLAEGKKTYITHDQYDDEINPYTGVQCLIDMYLKQTQTCEHHFVRSRDEFDQEYPDGRGECQHCKLGLQKAFPPLAGRNTISISIGNDVVSQYDWGAAYVQGGSCGIVLTNSGTYETAFVEAFPTIDGFRTFIRGEGNSIKEAETHCWEKYQRRRTCSKHEWSRMVRGEHRSDGYAECIHCGLTSNALEPETLCSVCQKPTRNKLGKQHICLTHYYEIPEDERAAAYVAMMSKGTSRHDVAAAVKHDFDYRFMSRLQSHAFSVLGETRYADFEDNFRSVIGYARRAFYSIMLQKNEMRSNLTYDESDHAKMDECHTHIRENWPAILEFLELSVENKKRAPVDRQDLTISVERFIPHQYIENAGKPI